MSLITYVSILHPQVLKSVAWTNTLSIVNKSHIIWLQYCHLLAGGILDSSKFGRSFNFKINLTTVLAQYLHADDGIFNLIYVTQVCINSLRNVKI